MSRRWRQLDTWSEAVAALLVLGISLKVAIGLHGTFDVYFDDETIYLDGARHLGVRSLPLAESSPLYPMWYRVLGFFEPDPLKLYFLDWFVLTASLPLVLYWLARRSGATLVGALGVASVWAMSSASMTWPFVSKFATLILGFGAIASTYPRDRRIAIAIGGAALTLAGYARPELVLPSVVFATVAAVWCVWTAVRTPSERRSALAALAIVVMPPLFLRAALGKFGSPFGHGRQFFAFGQHYALNVVEAKGLAIDPWTSWLPLAREAFPKAESIVDAAYENPTAFVWHLKRNISLVPTALRELLRPLPHVPMALRYVVVLVLIATVIAFALTLAKRQSRRMATQLTRWLPLLAAIALATGGSALLVYPRQHYILPLTFFGLAAVAALGGELHIAGRTRGSSTKAHWFGLAGLLVTVSLLAAVPTARRGALPALLEAVGPEPLPETAQENRATILALRKLELVSLPWGPVAPRPDWMPHVVILEPDYSRGVYSFYDFIRIEQWRKEMPFWDFVHATWTNVIILNARMLNDEHLKRDPEFVAFADGTGEREDFEMILVEGTTVVLAVRRRWNEFRLHPAPSLP